MDARCTRNPRPPRPVGLPTQKSEEPESAPWVVPRSNTKPCTSCLATCFDPRAQSGGNSPPVSLMERRRNRYEERFEVCASENERSTRLQQRRRNVDSGRDCLLHIASGSVKTVSTPSASSENYRSSTGSLGSKESTQHGATDLPNLRSMRLQSRCCKMPWPQLRPNPSLKRSANGRPPGPGPRYGVHFLSPGPGVLPSSPA